jgi:hypothetical protein
MKEVCKFCGKEKETVIDREDVYAKNVLRKVIITRKCKECFDEEWTDAYNELMDDSL